MSHRIRSIAAGAAYFAVAFAAGFLLGTVRTLLIAPRVGELGAVLIELPIILGVSWVACGWLLIRFQIPARMPPRLMMGVVAFTLLMLAEVALSVALFNRSMTDYFTHLTTTHGLVGLAGQVVFALMPLIHRSRP